MKLPALEKNILKYRAIEMALILFHAESLKKFIIGSIRSTDELRHKLHGTPERLPPGTKGPLKKAFTILVNDNVLTQDESEEVQDLIGFRNDIAHRIHLLTSDIVNPSTPRDRLRRLEVKYRYNAWRKFEHYRDKIERGLRSDYVLQPSFDTVFFKTADRTYKEELNRLRKKIDLQFELRKQQIEKQQAYTKSHRQENTEQRH